MSIKITTQTTKNYDYGYTVASSASSSSGSSNKYGSSGSSSNSSSNLHAKKGAMGIGTLATPSNWQSTVTYQQPAYQPQPYNPVNDYENATPDGWPKVATSPYEEAPHAEAAPHSPTSTELNNASSYISYLVNQLNEAKDKLEKAEEKIVILEKADFKQYKEYLISSIDKFLAERSTGETLSAKEIFQMATGSN
jgi:hypothetical protein